MSVPLSVFMTCKQTYFPDVSFLICSLAPEDPSRFPHLILRFLPLLKYPCFAVARLFSSDRLGSLLPQPFLFDPRVPAVSLRPRFSFGFGRSSFFNQFSLGFFESSFFGSYHSRRTSLVNFFHAFLLRTSFRCLPLRPSL